MRKLIVLLIIALFAVIYIKTNLNLMDMVDTKIDEFTSSIFDDIYSMEQTTHK